MSGYTSEEVQAAVERLVLSTIRRPHDTLGVRRTDVTFSDVQQAAAGVFILYPNSPFYVLFLGTRRLNDLIEAESVAIDSLIASLQAMGRNVLPVNDVSTLFNAQAALQELGSAASKRAGVYADITKTPAYQRYSDNVSRFLGAAGQAVKEAGNIVQTPQEARAAIPGLLRQVSEAHANLVARVRGIANGIVDYDALSLPSIVASSVISNSAALIGESANALNSLTPTARLALVRQTVLNLLSTKAVVQTFGSFAGPSDFYSLNGLGMPFSDAEHAALPAVADGTIAGGVAIIAGATDQMTLVADGGGPVVLTLNPSYTPVLSATLDDSNYVIGNGLEPVSPGTIPNNDKFKVSLDGVPYVATLTHSADAEGAQMTGTGDTTTAGWYGGGGLLDGTTLFIVANGSTIYSVTFVAPANAFAVFTQISAVTNTGAASPNKVFPSIVADRLVLTTELIGAGAKLVIPAGTANAVLGFTNGQTVNGTSHPRTADEVADDINITLNPRLIAEGFYAPLKFTGLVNIPAGVNTTWTAVSGATDFTALNLTPFEDTAHVVSGPNTGFWLITGVTPTTLTVQGTTLLQNSASIEAGYKFRRLRIRVASPSALVALESKVMIFGDDEPSKNALTTIGYPNNFYDFCRKTTPDLVANDISSKTTIIAASTRVVNSVESVIVHADITDPSHVVFARAAAVGDTVFVGAQVTLTVTAISSPGTCSSGDTLALRTGPSPGHGYVISTINGEAGSTDHVLAIDDVVVATGGFAGANGTGVGVEVGPTLVATKYDVVTIDSPNANSGAYFVQGNGDTALDISLISSLGQTRQGATSTPATMTASYGKMFLSLSSKNTTTASALNISGGAAGLFYSSVPSSVLGSSPWLSLPAIPRGLQAGDVLEYYPTNYSLPSNSYVVNQVIPELKVIGVDADANGAFIPDGSSWQFSPQPVPFARLRFGTKNNFTQVVASLNAWLANSVNQPLFFENFNRLINPLLANSNPTAAQVGTAVASMKSLYAFLTGAQAEELDQPSAQALDQIVQTFTVEQVAPIDALLRSFAEKGSDRATDILLQGLFSTFFSLTSEESSYSGAFQAATRSVARNDLPVRRFNRAEVQSSQLISQTQSPDFEFQAASITENLGGEQVNPPATFGEPSNFGTTTGSKGAGT
jgi:hypothetical protein